MSVLELIEDYKQRNKQEKLCYSCKHRDNVAGSAHSCCNVFGEKGFLISIANLYTDTDNPTLGTIDNEPIMKVDKVGIKNGWFNFPINYDPEWLEYCLMYEGREIKENKEQL